MLNTLSIARKLFKSGVDREHAEAIADVVSDAVDQKNENLATKNFVHDEIKTVREEVGELRGEVGELRGEVKVSTSILDMKITSLTTEINAKITSLKAEVDAKISGSEVRIVRWIVGTGIGLGILDIVGRYFPA